MFQPAVLTPEPDPFYVRELHLIDPNLRIVWAYQRYFKNCWAIERKMPPERYFQCHASLFEEDLPRFVEQPIFDTNQPIYDDEGEVIGHKEVGRRKFDLAPEWEWVDFVDSLDGRLIIQLKRAYAWERNHSLTRLRIEKENEEQQKELARKKVHTEIMRECVEEAWREHGKIVQGSQPKTVLEGTEL